MVEAAIQGHGRASAGMMPAKSFPTDVVTVLESMGDAFYALDRDWRFTYVNGGPSEPGGARVMICWGAASAMCSRNWREAISIRHSRRH